MERLKTFRKCAAAAAVALALGVGVSAAQNHGLQILLDMKGLQEKKKKLQELDITEWEHTYPLHFALHIHEYDRAIEVIPLMTDMEAKDPWGRTPLSLAADDEAAAAYDMTRALLQYGADPNGRDSDGWTPLHYAAAAGNLAVVEMLADRGAKIDAVIEDGEDENTTPLYLAYKKGRTRVIEFLKNRGGMILDDEQRKGLEIQAKAAYHYERMTAAVPQGMTSEQESNWLLERSMMAKRMALAESGHLSPEELEVVDVFYEHYLEGLERKRPADVSYSDWLMNNLMHAIEASVAAVETLLPQQP